MFETHLNCWKLKGMVMRDQNTLYWLIGIVGVLTSNYIKYDSLYYYY